MDCRLSSLDFDIAASAGWYSAIAGLLAGFALLSILLPLDHEAADPDESQSGNAVVVFTCAFVSLLALGFAFAVLAGRTGDGDVIGVAAHEQVVYGSAFGLAAILMLFGLHAVLRTYGANRAVFGPAQRVIVLTTSVLAPVVLLALQFGSALDVTRFRAASDRVACDVGGLPNTVWIDLGIVAVASSALVLMWLLRARIPRRDSAPATAAKAVLGYTVAAVVWGSMVVPLLPADVITGFWFEHLFLAVAAAATVGVAASSWMGR
jgi:hypothetical protein